MGRPVVDRLDHGERAVRFLNRLTHTGDYAGQAFALRTWQEKPVRELFGTVRDDGTRRYRKTFWALPRKQGKTEIVAGGGLYLLMGQGRTHQKIYTASGDFKQATLIFEAMADMIRADPVLESLVTIYDGAKKIVYHRAESTLEVLSSVPKSKHGLGPTAVLIDELHVVDEELVNVLTTGFGARRDPLTWMITTAGWDQTSLCYDEWQYALQVRDGAVVDDTYLPVIFAADPADDWHDEATWRKAMPALGDFCELQFIREEHSKAIRRPRFENAFKQLYLNLWTEAACRWLDLERWKAAAKIVAADYRGRTCYGGLDLGVNGDMAAWAGVFPNADDGVDVLLRYWAPRQGRWRDEERARELYPRWEKEGWLKFTDGEATDFNVIEADLLTLNQTYGFKMLLADRAYATQLLNRLYNLYDVPVKGIGQGALTMNEPMIRFEGMLIEGAVRHEHNPIAAWNVANAAAHTTSTGLIHLDKSSATRRIDGLAATLDGVAGMLGDPSAEAPSVYETRGLIIL